MSDGLLNKKRFKQSKNTVEKKAVSYTFEQCLKSVYSGNLPNNSPEPLSSLDYEIERELKNKTFAQFLEKNGLKLKAQPLFPSPKARHYRTTTKRRVFCGREGVGLGFSETVKPGAVAESKLEPVEHLEIYKSLQELLSVKTYSSLARALNWLIIRGTYERQFLILNIFKMDGGIVRKLKQFTQELQKGKIVEGAVSYFDPSRSEYYLEAEKPPKGLQVKHLFGPRLLGLKVDDILMRYSPTGFSQVNESMVAHMVELAGQMLSPRSEDHLMDLYCGYGLFSHIIGTQCKKVTGYELSTDAINSAREISRRLKTTGKMKFFAERIDARLVRNKFAEPTENELLLLDPPRKGCEPRVISELAKRNPKRVLHIFCGTDVIPKEIKQWQDSAYKVKTIQPIDMFAGTANLETMVLLERG